jgi:hypothetical protein
MTTLPSEEAVKEEVYRLRLGEFTEVESAGIELGVKLKERELKRE